MAIAELLLNCRMQNVLCDTLPGAIVLEGSTGLGQSEKTSCLG